MPRRPPKGRPPSERTLPPLLIHEDPRRVAIHESGHSVIAVALGIPITEVTVKPRRLANGVTAAGHCRSDPIRYDRLREMGEQAVVNLIAMYLAGACAEELFIGEPDPDSFEPDREMCSWMAASFVCGTALNRFGDFAIDTGAVRSREADIVGLIERGQAFARELVRLHYKAIHFVAKALLDRKSLTGEEVAALVSRHSPAAMIG